jgi:proline racemase
VIGGQPVIVRGVVAVQRRPMRVSRCLLSQGAVHLQVALIRAARMVQVRVAAVIAVAAAPDARAGVVGVRLDDDHEAESGSGTVSTHEFSQQSLSAYRCGHRQASSGLSMPSRERGILRSR